MAGEAEIEELNRRSERRATTLVGHHGLDGRGDGMQVLVVGAHAYVAHLGVSDAALSILDVSDPSRPALLRQLPHAPNTHSHKVQIGDGLLLQNLERLPGIAPDAGPNESGLLVYDLSAPAEPRLAGRLDVPGRGFHRTWYTGGRYAHVAAYMPGYRARVYLIVDLRDPTRPEPAAIWHIPGTREGESDGWRPFPGENYGVHGIVVHGDRAYVSCLDAGVAIVDISDMTNPRFVGRVDWSPPYGGFTHTCQPLPSRGLAVATDESTRDDCQEGEKRVWVLDIREERNPMVIASFPQPVPPPGAPYGSFCERGMRFGPHNVHELRPGYGYRSEHLIFTTYYNAGLRIVDLTDPFRPEEVGYFIPPAPDGQRAPQINDLFVDERRLIYTTDRYRGGLYVLRHDGPDPSPRP